MYFTDEIDGVVFVAILDMRRQTHPVRMRRTEAAIGSIVLVVIASMMICACTRDRLSQEDQSALATQAMRDEISSVVMDVERRQILLAAVDRYDGELRTFQRTVLEFQTLLHALNADPEASRDQFSDLIARYEVERTAARARLVQVHQDLLGRTTDDEWRSIAKREVKLLRLAVDPATMRART